MDMDDLIWKIQNASTDKCRFKWCVLDYTIWGISCIQGQTTRKQKISNMNVTIITGLDVREIYHATWDSCFDSIRKHGLISRGINGEGKAHIFATVKSALDNTPPLRRATMDINEQAQ